MENFEAFRWNKKLNSNLLFLKSVTLCTNRMIYTCRSRYFESTWWPEIIWCKSLLEGLSPEIQSLFKEPLELPLPPPPSISQSSTPLFLCLLLFRILSLKNSSPDLSRDGGEDNRLDANWDEDGVANNLLRWWFFLALSPEIRRKKFNFFIKNCYIMLKTKCTVSNKSFYQKDLLG